MKACSFLFCLFILLFAAGINAQNFDELLIETKPLDCADISQNSGLFFVKYVEESKTDSAKSLLQYWESKCGQREPVFRAKILLALKLYEYNDSLLNEGVLKNIFNYRNRTGMVKYANYSAYDDYKSYFGYTPPNQVFDKFTKELATQLMDQYESNTMEYLWAEFYAKDQDTIFSKLQTKAYEDSKLSIEYHEEVDQYVKMYEGHLSWITGVWIPTGPLSIMGVHPELGYQAGIKHKKMNYDLTMTFKFLNTPNAYHATRPGSNSPDPTRHFFGGYIGFDIGRDIWVHNQHELQLTGGVAFDGFDALQEDQDNDLESASASSYNFNVGLGYRFYFKPHLYLGIRAKYNVVDYTLNNVVDYKGHPITIQFIIGGVNNVYRNSNLKALKYKVREK